MRQTTDAPAPNSGDFRPRYRVMCLHNDENMPSRLQPNDPFDKQEAQALVDQLNTEWQAFGYEYYIEEY